jgi:hypothetical protein
MTLDWQSRRNTICKLYLNERRTLHDVNEVMKAHHNFSARYAFFVVHDMPAAFQATVTDSFHPSPASAVIE